ncbi:MAG: methylenetetrahydrofolate reductase C-terminal domain-containing protein [Woeseiaceae bacterium]
MYRMRSWSVRHARWLERLYGHVEKLLLKTDPALQTIGYERLDRSFVGVEKLVKGFLLDSQSCGQCIVSDTGMSCPMNCPKKMRNGPCGGVRSDGTCEVDPEMNCVWVQAWQGNKNVHQADFPIQKVQPPVDHRLIGHSAWLRELQLRQPALKEASDSAI